MLDSADDVKTNNTWWTLMVNKDGQYMLDTDGEVRKNKACWTLLLK